ncbi:uncharacterized protein LOC119671937 [Teleopsis dalmanni]|uniref:uncharacterized protein LOC119671937 n=1 Tax=Teleopsis dalmanni TaxID=139649 RepID=UPI0018CF2368|nr:uncharacterized protein LOC119671937 [Teleopsis dalmanni]
MEHKWVACANGAVPSLAVVGGHDVDGDTIYIGRAEFNNDLLPAKVIPNKGKAYVCYGSNEEEIDTYEVLSGLHYEWIPSSNGNVPAAAVKVGRTIDGEFLYAGRGYYEGSLCVGKVHPSHGCLYIPYGSDEIKLTEYEVLVQPDKWIDATADSIPEGALEGGRDADGDVIYVGRVFKDGDLMPAKVIPNKGGAYVCWGSEEHKVENFQVLAGAGFLWTSCDNGSIVPGAIPAGHTADGETLYVGRAYHAGSLSIGKIHPSHGCIYLPFGGEEIQASSYEVLVRT